MKLLLVSLVLFSGITNAATVCYKSEIAAVSDLIFTVKDAKQEAEHEFKYKFVTPGTSKCIDFNDQSTVSLKVFHDTGIIWKPRVNTCNFENITKSTMITSHGNVLEYSCTEEAM